jgi:hypothetical protein
MPKRSSHEAGEEHEAPPQTSNPKKLCIKYDGAMRENGSLDFGTVWDMARGGVRAFGTKYIKGEHSKEWRLDLMTLLAAGFCGLNLSDLNVFFGLDSKNTTFVNEKLRSLGITSFLYLQKLCFFASVKYEKTLLVPRKFRTNTADKAVDSAFIISKLVDEGTVTMNKDFIMQRIEVLKTRAEKGGRFVPEKLTDGCTFVEFLHFEFLHDLIASEIAAYKDAMMKFPLQENVFLSENKLVRELQVAQAIRTACDALTRGDIPGHQEIVKVLQESTEIQGKEPLLGLLKEKYGLQFMAKEGVVHESRKPESSPCEKHDDAMYLSNLFHTQHSQEDGDSDDDDGDSDEDDDDDVEAAEAAERQRKAAEAAERQRKAAEAAAQRQREADEEVGSTSPTIQMSQEESYSTSHLDEFFDEFDSGVEALSHQQRMDRLFGNDPEFKKFVLFQP